MTQNTENSMKLTYRLPPGMCDELGEVLCHTLLESSSYRFEKLKWNTGYTESGYLPASITCVSGHQTSESLGVIIHKSQGLLLLKSYEFPPEDSRQCVIFGIRKTHRTLLQAQRQLRRRLDRALPSLSNSPLVGIGVVVREFVRPEDLPGSLPEEIVIEESQLGALESRLNDIFGFFRSDGATAAMIPAHQMRKAVEGSIRPGGRFYDEAALVRRYNERYQLYPPLPPAA